MCGSKRYPVCRWTLLLGRVRREFCSHRYWRTPVVPHSTSQGVTEGPYTSGRDSGRPAENERLVPTGTEPGLRLDPIQGPTDPGVRDQVGRQCPLRSPGGDQYLRPPRTDRRADLKSICWGDSSVGIGTLNRTGRGVPPDRGTALGTTQSSPKRTGSQNPSSTTPKSSRPRPFRHLGPRP